MGCGEPLKSTDPRLLRLALLLLLLALFLMIHFRPLQVHKTLTAVQFFRTLCPFSCATCGDPQWEQLEVTGTWLWPVIWPTTESDSEMLCGCCTDSIKLHVLGCHRTHGGQGHSQDSLSWALFSKQQVSGISLKQSPHPGLMLTHPDPLGSPSLIDENGVTQGREAGYMEWADVKDRRGQVDKPPSGKEGSS